MFKKFVFSEKDSIYNIFEVIEKISKTYKDVVFDINPKNEFFSNKWWLKLVLEKAKEKWIDITFLIENSKQEAFLKSMWVKYIWRKVPFYKKIQKSILDFLDLFKSEHSFYKKHYNIIKIFLLWVEIALVFFAVYFLYNLVTPKTDVYIQPAVNIKHIVKKIYTYPAWSEDYKVWNKEHIEYKKVSFDKVYSIKLPVKDIQYIAKPSYWIVKFYNTTSEWLSLKANTVLKTEDGLLFRLQNWVYIPPRKWEDSPWEALVKVKAETADEEGKIIWERWNLVKWTRLYIQKIYLSYWKKKIYAEVEKDFSWWETNAKWEVSLQDIELVKKQLFEQFKKDLKKNIYKYIQVDWNNKIPLLYDKLYGFENISYKIYANPGDKLPYIQWDIIWSIYFNYIDKKDLNSIFREYLKDRLVSENDFIWYDENSIEIINFDNISKWLYMITISINALLWYDFDEDYNQIIPKIIEQIKWKSIKEAKKIILEYPQIMWVDIKTTDALNRVSNLNSRIFIHIVK